MNSLKSSLLFLGLLALVTPLCAQEEIGIEICRLNDHLLLLTPQAYVSHPTMIASVGPDGLLLVDTGVKESSKRLKEIVDSLGYGDPKIIINSHMHIDHTGGNGVFENHPIIIAQRQVRPLLTSDRFVFAEFPLHSLPNVHFDDSLSVTFNGDEISIVAIPGGHSNNDALILFRNSRIAYIGDMAYGMEFPSVDGLNGNANKYPEVIKAVLDYLPADTRVIAGHGREVNMTELAQYHEMLVATTNLVQKELAQGKSVAELQEANILKAWDSYGQREVSADDWIQSIANGLTEEKPKLPPAGPLYRALKANGVQGVIDTYLALVRDSADQYQYIPTPILRAGTLIQQQGDYAGAVRLYRFAAEQFPGNWYPLYSIAEVELLRGDTTAARTQLQEILKIDPDNAYVKEVLKEL